MRSRCIRNLKCTNVFVATYHLKNIVSLIHDLKEGIIYINRKHFLDFSLEIGNLKLILPDKYIIQNKGGEGEL